MGVLVSGVPGHLVAKHAAQQLFPEESENATIQVPNMVVNPVLATLIKSETVDDSLVQVNKKKINFM